MKILVLSDSHGSPRRVLEAAMRERDADICIHLGDGANDADVLPTLFPENHLYRIQGNCDFDSVVPVERVVPLGGETIFMTHGHLYSVKRGLDILWEAARDQQAQVALFGHTHTPYYDIYNGIHLFNPGAISMPRGAHTSYGVIHIEKGEMPHFDIIRFPQK